MRAYGAASLMATHASMPVSLGIRTSMSTTSGVVAAASDGGGEAVGGLAHDLDVVLDVEQHGETAAEQLLVVDDEHADVGLPEARSRLGYHHARIMARSG